MIQWLIESPLTVCIITGEEFCCTLLFVSSVVEISRHLFLQRSLNIQQQHFNFSSLFLFFFSHSVELLIYLRSLSCCTASVTAKCPGPVAAA